MGVDVDFGNAIVCDDVRREITGKDILIGVYPDGINVLQIPGVVILTFWIELIPKSVGELEIELRVDLPDGTSPLKGKLAAQISDMGRFPAIFPAFSYNITRAGTVTAFIRSLPDGEWREVKRVELIHSPNALPNVGVEVAPTT